MFWSKFQKIPDDNSALNSAFGLSSDTPKEPMMDTPDYFDADLIGHDEGNLLSGIDKKNIRK